MGKCCKDCRRERTPECKNPQECIANGFSRFRKARIWEKCEKCGAKLLVVWTDVSFGRETFFVHLKCADSKCGLKAKLTYQYERVK